MSRDYLSLLRVSIHPRRQQNPPTSDNGRRIASSVLPAAGSLPSSVSPRCIYDVTFWLAYLSNALVSAGNVLLCRYADYVNFLGADEYHLGWIIGFGMVGSLFMRFALGSGIDRFGARRVWLLTILATALGCLIHLGITDYRGIAIYLARVFYIISLAGVFSASMTLIAARAPRERLAEVVGIYGSAGFAGVLLGAPLADLLFPAGITSMGEARLLFLTAGGMCLLSFPLAWFVPPERAGPPRVNHSRTQWHKTVRRSSLKEPALFHILLRYTSVPILIAGIVAGAGLSVPPTFLPRYVAQFGVHSVSGFFFLYAATAIVIRGILLRRVSNPRLDRMILLGTIILCISQVLFLFVHRPWQLVFPGLVFGIAQALLFPAIVAAGSMTFPKRHRGLATTLMMATFDAGLLLGGPVAGITLRLAGQLGWPRYPTMFLVMAGGLLLLAVYFAGTTAANPNFRSRRRRRSHGSQPLPIPREISQQPPVGKIPHSTSVATITGHRKAEEELDVKKPVSVTVDQKLAQATVLPALEASSSPTRPILSPAAETVGNPV